MLRGRSGRVQEGEKTGLGGRVRRKSRKRRSSHRRGEWAQGGGLGSRMKRRCSVERVGEREHRVMMMNCRTGGGSCGQGGGVVRPEVAVCSSSNESEREERRQGRSNKRDSLGGGGRVPGSGFVGKADGEHSRGSLGGRRVGEGGPWDCEGEQESPTVVSRVCRKRVSTEGFEEVRGEKGGRKTCMKNGSKSHEKEGIAHTQQAYSGRDNVDGKDEILHNPGTGRKEEVGVTRSTSAEKKPEGLQCTDDELFLSACMEDAKYRGFHRGPGDENQCTFIESMHNKNSLGILVTSPREGCAQGIDFRENPLDSEDMEEGSSHREVDPATSIQQHHCTSPKTQSQCSKANLLQKLVKAGEKLGEDTNCKAACQAYKDEFAYSDSPKSLANIVLRLKQTVVCKPITSLTGQCTYSGHSKTTSENRNSEGIEAAASPKPEPKTNPDPHSIRQKSHCTSCPPQKATRLRYNAPSVVQYVQSPEAAKCSSEMNTSIDYSYPPGVHQGAGSMSHRGNPQLSEKKDCKLQIKADCTGPEKMLFQVCTRSSIYTKDCI